MIEPDTGCAACKVYPTSPTFPEVMDYELLLSPMLGIYYEDDEAALLD